MCEFCSVTGECSVCTAHEDGKYACVEAKRETERVATVATRRILKSETDRGTDNRSAVA